MQINLIPGIFSNGSKIKYNQIFKISRNIMVNDTINGFKGYKSSKSLKLNRK